MGVSVTGDGRWKMGDERQLVGSAQTVSLA